MDIGDSIFEYGQTYVALSRIKRIEGLYLTALNINKIKVNPKVFEFYKNIEKKETILNIENYKYIEDNEKTETNKDIKIVKL